MAISEAYANSATISTTEYSLPNNSTSLAAITDDGVYQLFLELNNLTDTEVYELKIKEKVQSSSTQRVVHYVTLGYAQGNEPVFPSPTLILMHGWDMTLKKLSGTDRAIAWSIRKVA